MTELNPQPLPPVQSIRVSAPPAVLNDLETFTKALQGVLQQAGCPACTSGLNIQWQVFTDFVANEAGEVQAMLPGRLAAG
jgi:hypothetical protein